MPICPFYLALLAAAVHAGAAAQGAGEQKMATPAQKSGSAAAPAPAAAAQASDMDALNERMRVRVRAVHRNSLKRLMESDTMLVPNGNGDGIVKADAARRAAEIAQAGKRVADDCK